MSLRQRHLDKLRHQEFDVLIVGGGINGAVSAAALAQKGAKVALVEKGDFAGFTSSNTSNLAWGGIKYLESGELLLVNKLCRSRNHLMEHYPSSVKEIRFFTTIRRGFRKPVFFVYLGALFYWLIGACYTRPPRLLSVKNIQQEEPIIDTSDVAGGVDYSDCYLPDNDSRFVFKFVLSAMAGGAVTANYVESLEATRDGDGWQSRLRDVRSGEEFSVRSKAVVNACGPYVDGYNDTVEQETDYQHLFSKGIHLIVDQVTPHKRILAFFASDGRLFFMIPMGDKTCVGTTDTQVEQPETEVTPEDRQFVLDNVNELLRLERPLTTDDIIAERCGVRPLAVQKGKGDKADWVNLSRKHQIEINETDRFISIFGGKLTDCVNVGEEVVDIMRGLGIEVPQPDTLWYGEPAPARKQEFMRLARRLDLDGKTPASSVELLSERFWRRYGERAFSLLEQVERDASVLEKPVDAIEYTRCELELMAKTEMIVTLEDFMRRRSKVSQVLHWRAILDDPGLLELCRLLFGDEADAKLEEYRRAGAMSAKLA